MKKGHSKLSKNESEKLKKGGGTVVQGQILKGCEGWHIWKQIVFFCQHNFMKKGHFKLSKNEAENIPKIKIIYW